MTDHERTRLMMLNEILTRAWQFEIRMTRRRYYNNAAGVRRFREELEREYLDTLKANPS